MTLSEPVKKFILHWGEMGWRWGVNRSVAQIHALLFLSPKPLSADDLSKTLSISRSNVSNCLKELLSWRLIKPVSVMGDRSEYFETPKDIWEIFRVVMEERKRREMDPTLAVLREVAKETDKKDEEYAHERLNDMLEFFQSLGTVFEEIQRLPTKSLSTLVGMSGKAGKILALAGLK